MSDLIPPGCTVVDHPLVKAKVTILRNGSEIAVSIVPDPGAASAAATPPVAAVELAAAPVAPAALASPVSPASPAAPAAVASGAPPIDRLFRLMVEAKASDLHLSSGMPPLVRKDGKI